MAGALRVRLGGENTYDGERIAAPLLGAEFEPPKFITQSELFGWSLLSLC